MPSVLFVDDDMNLLQGLRRSLRDQPYNLFIANSAEMAMSMCQREAFDLVVADYRMSGMSGMDLVNWLAENLPDTVCIMLTGHADVELMKEAINQGHVFRFLTKPCHDVELSLAVREGLELQLKS
ncbi:response regulator [Planctomycetes bacterium K23_9]|uniref:Hydrogenase transcriptional regulatory protein hupR1 n=1 Tax=Stieleria marina TaxID=1930275 RepID=A0A517NYJ1_9BACT|nr:Hydrogenase transcriptional regulatory protein hupR1 [Planctomycetes bacterium K23_9]